MQNKEYFLNRCIDSIRQQTYQNYEIVICEAGKGMAGNTNEAMRQANGELLKILFMDDFFESKDSLKKIVDNFKGNWLVTGCKNDQDLGHHMPMYSDDIETGNNTIGSPSVLTMRNGLDMYFDEELSWLLDVDLYKRLYTKYGAPVILNDINVVLGVGDHQTTNILTLNHKLSEHNYLKKKYK